MSWFFFYFNRSLSPYSPFSIKTNALTYRESVGMCPNCTLNIKLLTKKQCFVTILNEFIHM
ncbi:hypothetical protein COM11_29600 [Bacillus pseudomycoides]|nr:hypothetical protein COM11_29600 [Bacillus pseudomycoides]